MSVTCKLEEWFLSVSQYAKRHGITGAGVRKAIKEGRLLASKIGSQWVIPKDELIKKDSRK